MEIDKEILLEKETKAKWEGFLLGIASGISIACMAVNTIIIVMKISG